MERHIYIHMIYISNLYYLSYVYLDNILILMVLLHSLLLLLSTFFSVPFGALHGIYACIQIVNHNLSTLPNFAQISTF